MLKSADTKLMLINVTWGRTMTHSQMYMYSIQTSVLLYEIVMFSFANCFSVIKTLLHLAYILPVIHYQACCHSHMSDNEYTMSMKRDNYNESNTA